MEEDGKRCERARLKGIVGSTSGDVFLIIKMRGVGVEERGGKSTRGSGEGCESSDVGENPVWPRW